LSPSQPVELSVIQPPVLSTPMVTNLLATESQPTKPLALIGSGCTLDFFCSYSRPIQKLSTSFFILKDDL
jgi:hypothetical protein